MILTIYFLVEDGSYIKPFLMLISIFHLYFVYISIIQNAKNNKILNQYALGVSLITSYLFFREFSKSELILILLEIIQFFIVTVSIDLSIRTITQGVLRVHKHTYPFALLLIIPILLVKGIFTHEIIRLVAANIIFFFIYYLPLIMLIRNSYLFRNYGTHFKTKMFLFVGINIIYILVQLVGQESIIGEGYLFFIYLNSILCLLHFSVCTARKPTNKNKDRGKIGLFIIVLMVFGVLAYLLRDDLLVLSYIGILTSSLFMINKEIHLLHILRNTKEEKDIKSINKLIQNIRDYEKEEIYKERMAAFLHDDILQDLLTVKRNLQDAQELENTDNSVTIVEELINRTREIK